MYSNCIQCHSLVLPKMFLASDMNFKFSGCIPYSNIFYLINPAAFCFSHIKLGATKDEAIGLSFVLRNILKNELLVERWSKQLIGLI